MAMEMVTIPGDMLDEVSPSHIKLYSLISLEPTLEYDVLAQRLKRSIKTVRRLEEDLIEKGYIAVRYERLPKGKQKIERSILDRYQPRLPLEIAS